jgi:serine/threonine protein kinase
MLASGAVQVPVPIEFQYYAVELASSDLGVCVSMGNWEPEQKLVAFRTMCRAIQRLHSHGIGHRDLKPRNFLVMVDGTVKLSDFGTARHLDGRDQILASYSGPPGEIAYTAPELCALLQEGDPSIARAGDIFGLGAILFELFTGTVLGNLIYDQNFIGSLIGYMYAVPRASRRAVYDGFVSSLANARPLPDLASFGPLVPGCILELLDRLYKCMASLDYRARLCNFSQIFLHIERCRLILRNERLYRRWKAEREKRRAARAKKTGPLGERQ